MSSAETGPAARKPGRGAKASTQIMTDIEKATERAEKARDAVLLTVDSAISGTKLTAFDAATADRRKRAFVRAFGLAMGDIAQVSDSELRANILSSIALMLESSWKINEALTRDAARKRVEKPIEQRKLNETKKWGRQREIARLIASAVISGGDKFDSLNAFATDILPRIEKICRSTKIQSPGIGATRNYIKDI